ncbi:hypothetical protein H8S75_23135 [Hungatella sp. L12]|uniref:Uncharacterized protein n=1 Tax=Hungatella hominis TaxID=2763050 RepID=A0ABR7HCB6_9FIRM|nr:hypothetical protein [Hungatella hominis]MBC5710838.1 hypothetical protein [Hungatella hominis]
MNNNSSPNLTPEENEILEVFASVIPYISKEDKAQLLGIGKGIAFKVTGDEKVLQQKTS